MKTPLFNSTEKRFTKRDSLGLQSLSSSIQARICPIINVVTPTPFYWAFLIWNYYHFYSLEENKRKSDSVFNVSFVKRNDFFFVLSNFLNDNLDGVVGKNNITDRFKNKRENSIFAYDSEYYSSHFGGMQYYNNGCFVLNFVDYDVKKINIDDNSLGAKLTRAFDSAIKNTAVYKKYISQNILMENVSREDLLELSKHLTIKLDNMKEVQELLYNAMFKRRSSTDSSTLLSYVEEYINLLTENGLIDKSKSFEGKNARKVLYGDRHPMIYDRTTIEDSKASLAISWELVIANQYYVACIERLWVYLLSILNEPYTQEEWINKAFETSNGLNLDAPLVSEEELTVDQIESIIYGKNDSSTLHSVLLVLMSLYKRFENRLNDFKRFDIKEQNNAYRIFDLVFKIERGYFESEGALLKYLLKENIIDRHEAVAKEKGYRGHDGYFFEKVDGFYYNKGETINPSLPPLRITNVLSVLKGLGKL